MRVHPAGLRLLKFLQKRVILLHSFVLQLPYGSKIPNAALNGIGRSGTPGCNVVMLRLLGLVGSMAWSPSSKMTPGATNQDVESMSFVVRSYLCSLPTVKTYENVADVHGWRAQRLCSHQRNMWHWNCNRGSNFWLYRFGSRRPSSGGCFGCLQENSQTYQASQ